MSKLNIDQKTIKDLFSDKRSDFLIPDYQRPYAWSEKECQTLWDDIFMFAFPDNDCTKFNSDEEYFLGPIVTFKNDQSKQEIIDGQQRLTTLMLLLRAFYERYGDMQDRQSQQTREMIEKCIWKTNEFGDPNKNALKINSEVASDKDKQEFLDILKLGETNSTNKSQYAQNYRFFQNKINEFLKHFPSYFSYFPIRILNNCILLPIEAESQDTALRIFSTLNDRGKPLSDADIFKAQFYKFYSNKGKKDEFISKWKELEDLCNKIFHPIYGTPMDELFTRYMYYERAKKEQKSSTTVALRKFYEEGQYQLLHSESTFKNLINLANFWADIESQNEDRFGDEVLRLLFILNYAPNGMWTYFVSVYYMANKDENGLLNNSKFAILLNKIIAFVWTYAIINPGVNALRTPMYAEMVNIVKHIDVEFAEYKFDKQKVENAITNYTFTNIRTITKSMLTWWAFQNKQQDILPIDTTLEIEHIYARNRINKGQPLLDTKNIELLGNKSLLEKRVNIRAADYNFSDKKRFYNGYDTERGHKEGTNIVDLHELSNKKTDFTEQDIIDRNKQIIDCFIQYLIDNNLIKD